MNYISTPLSFTEHDTQNEISRDLEERISMLDNLIELIVFTPRGSFNADPDFGFEYWDHEYSNVNDTQFNNNNTGRDSYDSESTKIKCQESIRQSLNTYAPELKNVEITMNLSAADSDKQGRKKVLSRHIVAVVVRGSIENGLGTALDYNKEVSFYIEPTAKRLRI